MCGIAGFVRSDAEERPQDLAVLQRMTRTLQHRGPDGEGYFLKRNVGLGHRRLAVIDLNSGQQPMCSADGSLTIVFNGEIYNYLELRAELAHRGHLFQTQSDTEAIIAAYREWGTECVKRFNGMWAFALWDERERKLFCSRDRAGEKPFFFSETPSAFVFGSEIKALFSYGVPRSVEPEVLDAYLCFTYVPGRQTFFKGIYKLLPGHSLIYQAGQCKDSKYWDLHFADDSEARTDETAILEQFTSLFEDSVAIRMRSDVPFGAFLSGGLDSASIVAVMSKLSPLPIRTCTIGFNCPRYDERSLSALVAARFRTDHRTHLVQPDHMDALLSALIWHYDEPFGDSSALPTYLLSKVAREHVTVALTGDGGDEALSGYTIHQGEKLAHMYGRLPGAIGNSLVPVCAAALRRVAPRRFKRALLRSERVVESCRVSFVDRLERKQNGFTRAERANLIRCKGVRPAREFIEEALKPVAGSDSYCKLNYWLAKVALPDDMLCKVDRASMAHSLETRVPFLDHRILELMASTSMRVKLQGFQRKAVLRKTVGTRLPAELLSARKRGFSIPIAEWLQSGSAQTIEQRALRSTRGGLLCGKTVQGILAAHKAASRDASQALWTLSMLADHVA